jgi:HPt (histidine-containing phosphotransfer) domain-containing protein
VKCQNEIISELQGINADSNPKLIKQLVHKIIGGASIIQALGVIDACKRIDDASFCNFEDAKSILIAALKNNNDDIHQFLNHLQFNSRKISHLEKMH